MTADENEALLKAIEAVVTVAAGGVVAVFFTHKLTIDRERKRALEQRKRAFLAFIDSWKFEISRVHFGSGGFERNNSAFADIVSTFIREASLVKWDFSVRKRREFETLCQVITGNDSPSIHAKGHQHIIEALDKISQFVNAN
jgi:hypothetical protein